MATDNPNTASNETFAACLKEIRSRVFGKQFSLANEIGCTDAALSHWENGSRLPRKESMRRVFQALERGGALPNELVSLLVAWRNDLAERAEGACPAPIIQPKPSSEGEIRVSPRR
jgi:transcriptional regulator with XRE-family HTH domain